MTALLAFFVACAAASEPVPTAGQPPLPTVTLVVGATPVVAEVADDDAERTAGLMFRSRLGTDQGMVFVYPREAPRAFWMRNTILPLSIAYLDDEGVIVRLADMTPKDETPVPSGAPAMYALEMAQGWFVSHGVAVGVKVTGLPAPAAR
jgi:uncharacterized membrane protein (UPF0127 family)